jgi:hypothetical protein
MGRMHRYDFLDDDSSRIVRVMTRLPFLLAIAVAGCSGAHVIDADTGSLDRDGGGLVLPDAAPGSCHLASPPPLPAFAGEGCYCDGPFVVRGDVAYRQSYQLEVIDVSVPGAPQLVTSLTSSAVFADDIDIVGDVLFTAGGSLERFDLADPRAPVSLGRTDLGGFVESMAAGPSRVVVAMTREDRSHVLLSIDASDPRAIHLGTPLALDVYGVGAMALLGNVAFGVAMDGTGGSRVARVIAVDVADIMAPRVLGTLDTPVAYLASVGIHDRRLFVSGIESGVRAIDISDPTALRDLGLVLADEPGAQAVAVTGDVLVVAGSGLRLYDLSTPAMTLLGRTDPTSDSPHAVVTRNQLLGSGGNALFSIPLACD